MFLRIFTVDFDYISFSCGREQKNSIMGTILLFLEGGNDGLDIFPLSL